MSSTLINVGTEANDGTGDPPRTAFSKVNANFQGIDQALVATETTAQLNDRDTANRARANHTGTQTTSTIANFASEAAAAAPVQSVAGKTGEVLLAKADVGLGQADNTSDIDKPLSTATEAALGQLASSTQAALDQKLEAGDIAAFETNAQLDARDTANRARANHTGAQAISTVTGLQTALNAKLEASAIASFETTTQLNARDTANRSRANHTGTQPANTIEGLSSVATSGAYTDLSGRPTVPFGFTYDQQVEPIAPTVGQTWRERSVTGLIVETWQWDGTYWEKPATEFVTLFDWATQISATTGTYGNPMGFAYKLLGHRLNCALASEPQSGSDYWEFYGLNGGLIFDSRTLAGLTTNAVNTYVSMLVAPSIHAAGDLPGSAMRALRQGSAGLIRRGGLIALYRRIRA
ncbi:hypothetical protein ACQ4N7_24830 [Nodosilinea sp. AN01ver1]|uniref:hypothetical protein n=1 Tax=Nodosilinea sp. AN01ver1 TaxID=3423362 RepID=UPI003D3136F1